VSVYVIVDRTFSSWSAVYIVSALDNPARQTLHARDEQSNEPKNKSGGLGVCQRPRNLYRDTLGYLALPVSRTKHMVRAWATG